MPICKLVTLSLLCFLFTACTGPLPNCSIDQVLIEESSFPAGTYFEPLISPAYDRPQSSATQGYSYAPDNGGYTVTKWPFSGYARSDYNGTQKVAFKIDKYRGPWETPADVFVSKIADNYFVACGLVRGVYECRVAAQYSRYSFYFRSTISSDRISLDDLNRLLEAIDKKMASCS